MLRNILLVCSAALALGACASSRPVKLTYSAPAGTASFPEGSHIAIGNFTDIRENGANWMGAIRGGYGNPLKVLEAEKPVRNVVEDVFVSALETRGLMPLSTAKNKLDITVKALNSSQYVRREAHVELLARVTDSATGDVIFSKTGKSDNVDGSVLAMNTGILADPEDLRALLNTTLEEAVNQIVDDPEFRTAVSE